MKQLVFSILILLSYGASPGLAQSATAGETDTQELLAQNGQWVSDLPLMSSFQLEADTSLSFDSPAGRVLVLFGTSAQTESELAGFYTASLSALGWSGSWPSFTRAAEELSFEKSGETLPQRWKMTLRPLPVR